MNLWRTIRFSIACALVGILSGGPAVAQKTATTAVTEDAERHPVLMISIDGMRHDAVLQADKYGLEIPVLRSLLKDGSYAQEVINVNPTVTNPNHTTLVTGVLPAEHGIYDNRPFVPSVKLPESYSAYADIKAPTLWHAAKAAGLTTGSIFWPVTAHATDIDFNIREGDDEDNQAIANDAIALIEQEHPEFLTVHFVAFDHREHEFGPFSAEANVVLEQIDTAIGRVIAAERKAYPDSVVVVVSDHGFFKVSYRSNLNAALTRAGFITLDDTGKSVASWKAFAWYVGGSAMIVLHDPGDEPNKALVKEYLQKLAADPSSGIERVYARAEVADLGFAPNASFVVALKDGYTMGNSFTGPLRTVSQGGAHGAFSTRTVRPDMHSSFFITGPGIIAGKNLGIIDMRQIAPTVAGELKISLPTADMPALALRDG